MAKKPDNFMDYVPRHNKNYEYDVDEKGKVTIHVKWKGPYHKIATVLFKKPDTSHIDLDDIGSWVWTHIDGKKTVFELSEEFKAAFPSEENPLVRLSQFLNILRNNQFIVFNVPLKED